MGIPGGPCSSFIVKPVCLANDGRAVGAGQKRVHLCSCSVLLRHDGTTKLHSLIERFSEPTLVLFSGSSARLLFTWTCICAKVTVLNHKLAAPQMSGAEGSQGTRRACSELSLADTRCVASTFWLAPTECDVIDHSWALISQLSIGGYRATLARPYRSPLLMPPS